MKTAYIFSGQGAQTVGMGKDLYENSPAAKAVYDKADEILGWSVSDVCFNGPAEKLTETKYCQVAIYTTSMACLAYYREKNGGDPDEVIGCAGLSLGEYSALAAAGFFTFEDGLKLLEQRALFMDEACRATTGGMASILAGDPAVIAEVCAECGIDVANLNCPGQIVISGEKEGVVKACGMLKEKGMKRALPLNVAGAFHSRLMASAGEKLRGPLAETPVSAPAIPVAQNFTGKFENDPAVIKENLAGQVAGSVRWEECVRAMIAAGAEQFVEFGPGNVLTGLVKRTDATKQLVNINGI
ncbi:MAG: ACP S-malonyltransferase [Lentisphaeria bacterium]|nr:ACP S-malonyltransferase [Lentisphaeria bacterium]